MYRVPSFNRIMEALNKTPKVVWCDAGEAGSHDPDVLDMELSAQVVEEDIPTFTPKPANGWNPTRHLSGPAWINTVDQRVSWGGPSLDNPGSGAFSGKSGAGFILWSIPGLDSTPGPKGKMNANSKITASTEDAEGVVTLTREAKVSVFSGGGWDYMKIMDSARTEANKTVGGYDPMFGKIENVEFIQQASAGVVAIRETFLHRPVSRKS